MPTTEYIKINGQAYAVHEGGIRMDDAVYSPGSRQWVTPDFEDITPTDKMVQSDWHGGGGFYRVSLENAAPVYNYASNIDPSFPKRFFLSPETVDSKLTAGTALGVAITHMILYKGNVFAFGGTKGFFWDVATYTTPAANSGNIWQTTGPSGATTFPGTVTGVCVYNGYLLVACGTGAFVQYTTDSTPTLAGDWTAMAGTNDKMQFMAVLNGTLYGARSATGAYTTAAVYATTDPTAGFATLTGTVSDSSADVTNLIVYSNNLVVLKTDGIYLFDSITGTSFQSIQGLPNYIATTNGTVATEHLGNLFFKTRESLSSWSGNTLMGLSATRGVSFHGNDAQLENDTPMRGSPQAILSVPPFLYVTVYTGSKYVIKKLDAQFGDPAMGFHDWIDLGNNASTALFYWANASGSPYMFAGKGTGLVYWVMPRRTHLPTEDSACRFVSTGDFYTSRLLIGGIQWTKAVVGMYIWVEGLTGSGGNTATLTFSTDNNESFTDPTSDASATFTTNGIKRIVFKTGSNTISGREFMVKVNLTSVSGATTPIVYMLALDVRIQYPYARQWLITIPAYEPKDSHIKKTPKKIEEDLRTARRTANSITFVDHFDTEHVVDFVRFARQGAGKKATGDLTSTQGNYFFEVQLVEWNYNETV